MMVILFLFFSMLNWVPKENITTNHRSGQSYSLDLNSKKGSMEIYPANLHSKETLISKLNPTKLPPEEKVSIEIYPANLHSKETLISKLNPAKLPPEEKVSIEIYPANLHSKETLITKLNPAKLPAKERASAEIYPTHVRRKTIEMATKYLREKPITVTASICKRSAGNIHDFYSEGDYWWPDPSNPNGPYIQRDGETNPENFVAHRLAMIRFSQIVGSFASAYLLTGNKKFAKAAIPHFKAWFTDSLTRMNPNLLYAQAILGRMTGRGIGIIDTIHFLEVVKAMETFKNEISATDYLNFQTWFRNYVQWMTTHPYGLAERDALNNHSTCWALQVSVFARFTNDQKWENYCYDRYKSSFIPNQMAVNGSFPLELKRTKPYGYSLFNLDIMSTLAHVLGQKAWDFTLPDGRNIQKGVDFLRPFVADKSIWKYPVDVMYDEQWPIAQTFLFMAGLHGDEKSMELWKKLEHFPQNQEVIRNFPIRNPILWKSF